MKIQLVKTRTGLIPDDPTSEAWFNKLKVGDGVHAEFKKIRNYAFLKKWFALLNIGFENWKPGEIDSKYGVPAKNFERFRADVIILCGYYDNVVRLDGSIRIEPKSVSFGKMSEEEFVSLYSQTIDILIKYVYGNDTSSEEIEELVSKYLEFA